MGLLAACAWPAGQVAGATPFVPSKRWAVVVGANQYRHFSPLRYAVGDAKAFGKVLESAFLFEPSTLRYLLDEPGQTPPTAANVLGALDMLVADKRLDRGDLFVFYFAGHGVGTPEGDFLLPTDGSRETAAKTGVPVKSLVQRFVKAGLKNVLVVVDACRNGDKNPFGAELQQLGRQANIAVLLATAPGGRSYEIPRLGHGAFTYHLLRRLEDPALRSKTTGALWASEVAAHTRADVAEYTEREYGEDAQQPAVFTEKTQDVLLGAFVSADMPLAQVTQGFASESRGLAKGRIGSSLTQMGTALFLAKQYALAIEMYVTADQLGEATPATLFSQGAAMMVSSRWSEAETVFARLMGKDGNAYYAALATLISRSPTVGPIDKQRAALEAWGADKSYEVAAMAWSGLATAPPAIRRTFLAEAIKAYAPDTRAGAFFRGAEAMDSGRDAEAVALFERALQAPGTQPGNNQIRGMKLVAWLGLGTEAQIRSLIEEAIREGDDKPMWLLLRADRHRLAGETLDVIADAKEALANQPDPPQMLEAVRQTLGDCGALADLLEPLAKAQPYAWEAQLAWGVSAWAASGWRVAPPYQETVEKYAPDLLTAKLEHYDLVDDITADRIKREGLSEQAQFRLRTLFGIDLGKLADKFGDQHEPWFKYQMYSLDTDRVLPFGVRAYRYLLPMLKAGKGDSRLKRVAMVAAMTGGDDAEVDRLWSTKVGNDRAEPDLGWYYVTYLACRGRYTDADKVRKGLLPPTLGTLHQTFRSADLLVDAGLGKLEDVKKRVAEIGENIPSARQLQGMALLLAGDWDAAEQRLFLAAKERGWAFRWVSDTAILRLAAEYRKMSKPEELQFLRGVASTRSDTQFFEEFPMSDPPGIGAFVGTYEFDVSTVFDGEPIEKIVLTVTVDPKGRVVVKRNGPENPAWKFEGTLNAGGQVDAQFADGKHNVRVWMKLPPVKEYRTFALLQATGVYMKMVDADGLYGFWICKARASSPVIPRGAEGSGWPASQLAKQVRRSRDQVVDAARSLGSAWDGRYSSVS